MYLFHGKKSPKVAGSSPQNALIPIGTTLARSPPKESIKKRHECLRALCPRLPHAGRGRRGAGLNPRTLNPTWRFMVPIKKFMTVLKTLLVTILGHLRGLSVGFKYCYDWLTSTMNLQASHKHCTLKVRSSAPASAASASRASIRAPCCRDVS